MSFSDPFSEVRESPVSVAGQEVNSKIAIEVQNDDGEWKLAGIRSKDYHLIKNDVARDVGDDIMSRSDYRWKPLKHIWDGKRYVHYHITEEPITTIDTRHPKNPHRPIHLGMMMRNTYDGKGKFGLEIYAMDFICTNQFISRNLFGYFSIYHGDKQEFLIDDAIQQVSKGANNVLAIAPRIQELSSTPLTSDHIVKAVKCTRMPISKWGEVITRLALEESSMFGLYSAMTYIASHKLIGFNAISIGNTITDHFMDKTPYAQVVEDAEVVE